MRFCVCQPPECWLFWSFYLLLFFTMMMMMMMVELFHEGIKWKWFDLFVLYLIQTRALCSDFIFTWLHFVTAIAAAAWKPQTLLTLMQDFSDAFFFSSLGWWDSAIAVDYFVLFAFSAQTKLTIRFNHSILHIYLLLLFGFFFCLLQLWIYKHTRLLSDPL